MTRNFRKAVLASLGAAALAGLSTQASAQNTTYVGNIAIGNSFSQTSTAPNYAWDGNNNSVAGKGWGWGHNAKWFTFNVASNAQLDIQLTSSSTGFNPAFSLWKTTGYTDPASGSGSGHSFSQVSTDSKSGWLTDPAEGGVTSFIGYANSGPSFNNAVGLSVGAGSVGSTVSSGSAELKTSVAGGNYLLVVGGSNYLATKVGSGTYDLNIGVAAPVPEPEEYLMMLMGAGMVGFQVKRKKASKA